MIRYSPLSFQQSRKFRQWAERRRSDEAIVVQHLLGLTTISPQERERAGALAIDLVQALREEGHESRLEAMLGEYQLSSEEGVALMGLAEALLRIPDDATIDRLIGEQVGATAWQGHLGQSDSLFVNASTLGLALTGRMLNLSDHAGILGELLQRSGMPLVREALRHAMRVIGEQFVFAESIDDALDKAANSDQERFSFDMLGEAAMTDQDAERYFHAYRDAIDRAGADSRKSDDGSIHSISVKLSALHPRFEFAQVGTMLPALTERVLDLAEGACKHGVALTIDAEEAERLDVTLDLFLRVYSDPATADWEGLGLAVQAYQKSAVDVLEWLQTLSETHGKRIPLRLVKGAYWDREIKRAQQLGLHTYPVFTRKAHTDVSYLACASRLLACPKAFQPQFATHNAHTIAALLSMAGDQPFEFQRLHGMGELLFAQLRSSALSDHPCRVYAPVGRHAELLPYLIRRLLENGANSSFVNRLADHDHPLEALCADPIDKAQQFGGAPHPEIPPPRDLYAPVRDNSAGPDLSDALDVERLSTDMALEDRPYRNIEVATCDAAALEQAIGTAVKAQPDWDRVPPADRAEALDAAADFFEQELAGLAHLLATEAGKTVNDAVAEVRETADFCRYYAAEARRGLALQSLPAGAGEQNLLSHTGRGVFACISPWNFPLAIFTGQVAAALLAGNAVIAKPASQTPRIGFAAVGLLHEAGIPPEVLQLAAGSGATVGAGLVGDPRVAGIAFTGSVETAQAINRGLAARDGAIVPLIAETGGQNAMVVDSTALPEQVVRDVIDSCFRSAGQRCSALRVLYLQQEIADQIIDMLVGAMQRIRIGDPLDLATDVGPVIDRQAQQSLLAHATRMTSEARLLYRCDAPEDRPPWHYVPPQAYEIEQMAQIGGEVFGPILHVIRFPADAMQDVVGEINNSGFGLTFGVHSRLHGRARQLSQAVQAGNCYVNRNMIGAVVGAQPFGGQGLSGTGPKAGGPRYLYRFCNERTLSINTMATGGDTRLLSLTD